MAMNPPDTPPLNLQLLIGIHLLSTGQLKCCSGVIRMLLGFLLLLGFFFLKKAISEKANAIQSTTLFSSPSDIQIVPNEPCKINYLCNALDARQTKEWSHDEYINRHYSLQIVLLYLHDISTGNCKHVCFIKMLAAQSIDPGL